MTNDQREIHRKLRILQHAVKIGDVSKTCRYFGIGRASFYGWRHAYADRGEADLAIGEIGGEIEEVQVAFAQLRGDIEGMRKSVSGFIKSPADAISPAMIVSGLSAVSKLVRPGKK